MRGFDKRQAFTEYADEAWQASLFRLILIALLAGSVAAGPAILREGLGGPWNPYLIPGAMVFAGVAVTTTTRLGRPKWRDRRGAAFRLGEVLILLVVARIAVWILAEGVPGLTQIRSWFLHPDLFFTGDYVFASAVWLLSWAYAVVVTSDFLELAIQPDEMAAHESHSWGESRSQWRAANPSSRSELLERFGVRWIGIGVLLVMAAGITRIDVGVGASGLLRVGLRGLGMRAEVVACLVLYFLAGLLLMSQGRLAVLRGRWFNQDVEIRDSLIRRWHVNSLVFVVLIALVALLLPLGSTNWLTAALEWVIALLARFVMLLVLLVGILLSLMAALFAALFGSTSQGAPEQPFSRPPPPVPSQEEMTTHLPPWLGSALLWIMVALVAGFLLVNFLRTTGIVQRSALGKQLLQWRLWWRARRARMNAAVAAQVKSVRRRLRRVRVRAGRPQEPGTRREGPLLPRDQVRRYYLRAVKEAEEEGVARQPHATPLEFAEQLRTEWPETEGDVRDLTGAFVDARYSEHDVGEQEVSGAESAWRRLVRGLRSGQRRAR